MKTSQLFFAAACAAGLGVAQTSSATPSVSVSLNPTSSTTFNKGASGQTVTFDVNFANITVAADVVTFHNMFAAFDTSFLTFDHVSFTNGIVSAAKQGNVTYQRIKSTTDGGLLSYKNPQTGWIYSGTDYGNGSVRVYQGSDITGAPPYSALLNGDSSYLGQIDGFTAFSITFDVITDKIGTSVIALIDDNSYLDHGYTGANHVYDYKDGNNTPVYPVTPATASITIQDVPAPAPLALVALGLALLGQRRLSRTTA